MKTKLSHRLVVVEDENDIPTWFTYAWEEGYAEGTVVLIDSEAECGRKFEGVALVFDIESPNPRILLRQPTTAGLMKVVVEYVEGRPWLMTIDEALADPAGFVAGMKEVPPEETPTAVIDPNAVPKFPKPDEVVGYLTPHPSGHGLGIMCKTCNEVTPKGDEPRTPIYGINLNPYKSVCCECKKVIFEGCGTELFDGVDRISGR